MIPFQVTTLVDVDECPVSPPVSPPVPQRSKESVKFNVKPKLSTVDDSNTTHLVGVFCVHDFVVSYGMVCFQKCASFMYSQLSHLHGEYILLMYDILNTACNVVSVHAQ